jgi:hypothetical protein
MSLYLCASIYLGEMRASEAADVLAEQIAMRPPGEPSQSALHVVPYGDGLPVATALEKIGSPSIPGLIRNLTESDVEEVRAWSLMALQAIEADKDVVLLRLQKAVDSQTDATKKARLQSVIKSLTDPKFRMPIPI